jgi:hypothetical protein
MKTKLVGILSVVVVMSITLFAGCDIHRTVVHDASVGTSSASADAQASAKLLGAWIVPQEQTTALKKAGGFTFKSDGTFTFYAIGTIGDQDKRIDAEGKWKVEEDVLIEEVTKSSDSRCLPVGFVTRDTLIDITENEYRFRTHTGRVESRVRKKTANKTQDDTAR